MTLEEKAEKYAYDFHIRQHETGRSKSVYEVYIDGFNDGYDAGYNKALVSITEQLETAEDLIHQFLIQNPISDWLSKKAEQFLKRNE